MLGVGQACSCSQALRAAGLQLLSFPFDWLIVEKGAAGSGLGVYSQAIENDFADWFLKDDFVEVGPSDRGHVVWRNTRTHVEFRHDFDAGVELSENLQAVESKYRRRIRRMYDLIANSQKVLLVRLDAPAGDMPKTTVDECRCQLEVFRKRFPQVSFNLLLFSQDAQIPFDAREFTDCGDSISRIRFDYQNHDPRMGSFHPDFNLVKQVLTSRFCVRDYRTDTERETHAKLRRADVSCISVLVPAYNHEKYVETCIRSVMAQDWPNIELMVVDDGSRDGTWTKLQSLKLECERKLAHVEMVTQENRGTSFTWARLRSMAHGDFILTLASDDELAPGALSALVGPMLRDRRIGVCIGQNAFMDGEGRTCYWNRALEAVYDEKESRYRSLNEAICAFAGVNQFSGRFGDYATLLKDNYIANGCLIRTSELASVEMPAERVPLEDYWIHLQLSKRTRYLTIAATTFRYRWHATNTSHLREKMQTMTRIVYDREEQLLRETNDVRRLGVFMAVRCGCRPTFARAYLHWLTRPLARLVYRVRKSLYNRRLLGCHHKNYVSLGYNCEPAYRYFVKNGFCDSGLFQWSYARSIDELLFALKNLQFFFTGAIEGPDPLYRCANTKIEQHGKVSQHEWSGGITDANRALMENDRADLVGRMAHLREKFPKTLSAGGALVTYKVRTADVMRPDFNERLAALYTALVALGAGDFDFVLVCESFAKNRNIVLPADRCHVRYVERFNPDSNAISGTHGDNDGWQMIFAEFAPATVKSHPHAYKFEKST